MAKYIKCDNCGKRINFGETMYLSQHGNNAFCSPDCLVDSYGGDCPLDEEQAHYWDLEVYDDEQRKRELKNLIEETRTKLAIMEHELSELEDA